MNLEQWRHYWRGQIFQKLGRPDAAVQAYAAALGANPDFAQAARCLGYLHAGRREYARAEDYFLRALQLKPDAGTWFNLAFIRDQQGLKPQAIEAFKEAVRLDPKLDRAWYGLGLAEASLGHHEAAVAALEHAAQLEPRNPHVWYALGMAQHHCHAPDKLAAVARHLARFDPRMTRHLIQETGRNDLRHLVEDLEV
jgi:tetratricopeptide (TPR) repeat protein